LILISDHFMYFERTKQSLHTHIDILHDKIDLPNKIKEEAMAYENFYKQIFVLQSNIVLQKKILKKIIKSVTI
jgi:hypothetical protein